MSRALLERIKRSSYIDRCLITTPQKAIQHFRDGMSVGWSGFAPAGYPKVVPLALADHVEKNGLMGKMKFNLFAGASVGEEVEDRWASLHMTRMRWPYMSGHHIRTAVNDGSIMMGDIHLSNYAQDIQFGFFTKEGSNNGDSDGSMRRAVAYRPGSDIVHHSGNLDIAVVECTEILENGGIVPGAGVGITPEIVDRADKIILEVNTAIPSYRGLHDIVPDHVPPHRRPFLISRVDDRIGSDYVPLDPVKVVAIVESRRMDNGNELTPPDECSRRIAGHIVDFFEHEVRMNRMPSNLLPLQSGVGNIANAVLAGLVDSRFRKLDVWTEVLQDSILSLIDSETVRFASTASLALSPVYFRRFYENWEKYADKIIIRPQQVTNHPELIRRLGCIAMNTPIEIDLYAHLNSTLVGGTKMVHGIGGSGDFFRSGYVSIAHAPSTRPTKTDGTGISSIVPMCSHVDHTEHDINVVVTEQGLADVRGMVPRIRAKEIITKCAHPDYREQLLEYLHLAEKKCLANTAAHEPQLLDKCFLMHTNLEKNGTMKLSSWT